MKTVVIISFFISLLSAGTAAAYQTEKVIVVVLCGTRSSELMKDPTHQNIPNIWNNLKPQGVVNTGVETFSGTSTVPGHFALLTGAWNKLITMGFTTDEYRVQKPTMFEYARKGLRLPLDKVVAITGGENKINHEIYSLHPLYGSDYRAALVERSGNIAEDAITQRQLFFVMDTMKPSLTFVTFKAVDYKGHQDDWDGYLEAIKVQDRIVNEIWEKIESDPDYAGKTTLFVIGDHGRHDNDNGGFKDHGGISSDGDRSVPFLALGPDFRSDVLLSIHRKLIDLTPTIGELMGFDTPFADGRVMWELFKFGTGSLVEENRQSYPSLAVSEDNISQLVYQKTPLRFRDGNEVIQYLPGDGVTSSQTLSKDQTFSVNPSIAAATGALHLTYTGWLPTDGSYQNDYDWQHIFYRTSTDSGISWSDPLQISSKAWGVWKEKATIDVEGDNVVIVYPAAMGNLVTRVSTDGGASWGMETVIRKIVPRMAVPEIEGSNIYVVFHDHEEWNNAGGNRDIYCIKSDDLGGLWTSDRLTSDPGNDLNPDIAVSGDTVHIVWQSNRSGIWQIYSMRSTDRGTTWEETMQLSDSSQGALKPKIEAVGDELLTAWIDYQDGQSSSILRKSYDAGVTWDSETVLSTGSQIRSLDLSDNGVSFYLAREDDSNGEYEIFITEGL